MGHHGHLYLPCNAQFALYALLGGCCLFELVVGNFQLQELFAARVGIDGKEDECYCGQHSAGNPLDAFRAGLILAGFQLRVDFAQPQVFVVGHEAVVGSQCLRLLQSPLLVFEFHVEGHLLQLLLPELLGHILHLQLLVYETQVLRLVFGMHLVEQHAHVERGLLELGVIYRVEEMPVSALI